jgi:phosphatidylglycerophosphate synthase
LWKNSFIILDENNLKWYNQLNDETLKEFFPFMGNRERAMSIRFIDKRREDGPDRTDVPARLQDPIHKWLGVTPLFMVFGVTANAITIVRGLLIMPMIILLGFDFNYAAFLLHLLSWWGDAIDGSVARERKRTRHLDNEDDGEFLDPIIDKASWGLSAVLVPFAIEIANYVDTWLLVVAITAMSILVFTECVLTIVRWQDYLHNTKTTSAKTAQPRLNLAARNAGKTKMVLEVVGLSALIFSGTPEGGLWCYHIWAWALVAAVPLASMSLLQKISSRKTAS